MSAITEASTAIALRQSNWEQRARAASGRRRGGVDVGGIIGSSLQNQFMGGASRVQQRQSDAYTAFRQWVYIATSWVARRIAGQPWFAGELENAPKNPNDRARFGSGVKMAQPWLAGKSPRFLSHKAVSDEQLDVLTAHPVLDALAKPNPIQRKFEFLYLSAVSIQITGVAYWIGGIVQDKEAEGGERMELWAVPSNYIIPQHKDGLFSGYRLKLPGQQGEGEELDQATVARTYYADPTDLTAVYPPSAACWSAVRTDEFIQRSQEQLFERGLSPRIALVVGKDDQTGRRPTLQGPQRRALIRAVREVWDQTVRFGDPAILDGLIEDVKRLDPGVKEMDWINSGKVTKDRIFQTFGVHPFVVGDQATRTKAEAIVAEQVSCSNSVNPLIDSFSETATTWLGPMYEKPARLVIWIDPAKPDDEDSKVSKWNAAIGQKAVGVDEYRAEVLGLPPIEPDEPEPVLRTNQQAVTTVVQVLTAVGGGQIQRDSAIELLVEMGIDKKRAEAIVGEEPEEPPAPPAGPVPPGMEPAPGEEGKPGDDGEEEGKQESKSGEEDAGDEQEQLEGADSTDKAFKSSEWVEEEHPRDHGKFAPKEGGDDGGDEHAAREASVPEQVPTERSKSEIAKASATRVDSDIQRYAEEGNEPKLAKALGGKSLKDNEPVDVVCTIDGKLHGIELKTMVSNKAGKLTMKADAQARKRAWERKEPGRCHTVVFDDTKVFNAKGPGQHDESQRKIYYRRGFGSFRVDGMYEVKGGMKELKELLTTDKRKLPKGAK